MFGFEAAIMIANFELFKLEEKRWAALTPEQRSEELRLREVRALEQIARNGPPQVTVNNHISYPCYY